MEQEKAIKKERIKRIALVFIGTIFWVLVVKIFYGYSWERVWALRGNLTPLNFILTLFIVMIIYEFIIYKLVVVEMKKEVEK